MPKDTFFHLKEEKREKIEKALINEFSKGSFEKASISNIIAEAKIPKGSFYQYFENKEDAIKYVVYKYSKIERSKLSGFLEETNGNIFEATLKIYDYMVEQATDNEKLKLITNILQELRKNNISIFDRQEDIIEKEIINKKINHELLKIKEPDDLKYIMKILGTITRNIAIETVKGKVTKEEGKYNLKREIEILKKGMQKT